MGSVGGRGGGTLDRAPLPTPSAPPTTHHAMATTAIIIDGAADIFCETPWRQRPHRRRHRRNDGQCNGHRRMPAVAARRRHTLNANKHERIDHKQPCR